MPGISMCTGEGCEHKEKCYRHTAKPSKYQSYFSQPPMSEDGCHWYMRSEYGKENPNNDTGGFVEWTSRGDS